MSRKAPKATKATKADKAHKPKKAKAIATATAPTTGTLAARASFEAAGHGRRLSNWRPGNPGPNAALSNLSTLRARANDLSRNEWTADRAATVWGVNIIGVGIIARPRSKSATRKAAYTRIWDDFCRHSDADGVLDFYGQQNLAVENWKGEGETFVRLRHRRLEDGLPVPLQVQLLGAEMVPLLNADAWPGLAEGHRIRLGIELNRIGRRVAYWCYRTHPGDGDTFPGANDLVRVPASEIRHLFRPKRPGQLRGLPAGATVIAKTRNVGDFDDAVLERQKLANCAVFIVTRPDAEPPPPKVNPETGELEYPEPPAPAPIAVEPGISLELDPGQDGKFASPPDAGSNYPEYMRQQHLGIASGWGVPYESLTGDLKDISDRVLRVRINEFRRECEQYQWQQIIPICQWVREAVAEAAVIAGLIPARQAAEFADCTWHPHAWPYIHPTQDVQAEKMSCEAGFKSRAAIVAQRGDDVEEVDAERAEDLARERRLKIGAHHQQPTGAADA